MLSVFLIWIYIFLTTIILGYPILRRTSFRTEDRLMFGLMAVTVFSEVFSLFFKVSLVANIVLVIICVLTAIIFRKEILQSLKSFFGSIKNIKHFPVYVILAFLFAAFMAYGTSRGYFHDDSDLYHGQAIRWIEEYGIVKGLGNLHVRLAYNSASFALSALYSFSFLGGQSYHAVAGYIAMIMLASSLRIFTSVKAGKIRVSDFARLAVVYYCFNIYDEMVSPASDYFAMLFFLYTIVKLLELSERDSTPDEYASVAMIGIFTITLKLSTLPVIIACVLPIVMLIKNKKAIRILRYTAYAFAIMVPYFVREYLLSGRLFYPSTAFDIFSPVWKVPKGLVINDSEFIIAFARGYRQREAAQYPFREWMTHWIGTLGMTEKILLVLCIAGIIILPVSIILRKKFQAIHMIQIICIASFLFWLVSAPLVRYGQGYLLIVPAVMAGDLIVIAAGKMTEKKQRLAKGITIGFTVIAAAFLLYKTMMCLLSFRNNYAQDYYITQLDYGTYETVKSDVDGEIIYSPAEGDKTGYKPFPATPLIEQGLSLIGDDIKSGFYIKEQ